MRKAVTLGLLAWMISGQVHAQCSECTPVYANCKPGGGLCNNFDTAYTQSPFNQTLNFYMPYVLTDAAVLNECHCTQVDLQSITITGVTGLPTGINYTLNNSGQYNVLGGDTTGCVNFCGTPLLPGVYPVVVNLSADVIAISTPVGNVTQNGVPQSYTDTLIVLPDTSGGVSSFTYGNNGFTACGSININLNAVLQAPQPNMTSYYWQLPGGQTSTQPSPGSFTFTNTGSTPDTFPITLTTTYYNFAIDEVFISSISGRYSGGSEGGYLCLGIIDSPDAYVTFPALGYSNRDSSLSFTCSNIDFKNLNVPIPLGTATLDMGMFDKYIIIPPDDSIGTYSLTVELGQQGFSNVNADGWVVMDTVTGTIVTETLNVIVNPFPPAPAVTASADTFCSADSVLLSTTTGAYNYQWFLDTTLLTTQTSSSFYTSVSGPYESEITDQNTGCSSVSPFVTITSQQSPQGPVSVIHAGNELYVAPFSAGLKVKWYYNGNVVAGQSGAVISYLGDGTYSAEVYNPAYPLCSVTAPALIVNGINSVYATDYSLNVLPNPNNGNFKVQFYTDEEQNLSLNIRNVLGQLVYNKNLDGFSGQFSEEISLDGLSKGIYMVSVESNEGREIRKIIVQ